jgi:thymidylate synthase (FAD)
MKIDVLDYGYVRLVESMGSDLSVVRAARVSYDADWRAGQDKGSDAWLIQYLANNNHSTPFEAVEFQFEIKAPIFVFRQWHRHRTWSYNELSARYRELPEEYYVPGINQITTQHTDNKQMRTDEKNENAYPIQAAIKEQNAAAFRTYHSLIKKGCPRELARSVLPVGTYSHMFAKTNMLNLIKFLRLRNHDHAQYEIRVYAEAMQKLALEIAPISYWL